MATRLDHRVARLRQRKTDGRGLTHLRSKVLNKSEGLFDSAAEALEYIEESMTRVDQAYTDFTFEECSRVEKQIAEACATEELDVSFKHQGSVTTDTHIKFYSDIDLIVLTEKFVSLESPLVAENPYQGDPLQDLKDLREVIAARLKSSFYTAKVDTSGGKAIAISGGSLSRKIDVLSASWLDTQTYKTSGDATCRGIKLLDLSGPSRISNFPFIHNRELNSRDAATGGRMKRLIRFVKSARYDSDTEIKFSSYDIASICFHLPMESYRKAGSSSYELALEFVRFLDLVRTDQQLQASLYVPNKTRRIFGDGAVDIRQASLLVSEITTILEQAQHARGLFS